MIFKFFDYASLYKYSIFNTKEYMDLDINRAYQKNYNDKNTPPICFAKLYSDLRINHKFIEKLQIHIAFDIYKSDLMISKNKNHFYIFSDEERDLWLNEINTIIPFEYTIKEREDLNYFTIHSSLTGNSSQIKLFVTLVRYLWEHPLSFLLKEAINIFKYGYYEGNSLFQVLNLIQSSTMWSNGGGHNYIDPYLALLKNYSNKEFSVIYNESLNGNCQQAKIQTSFSKMSVLEMIDESFTDIHDMENLFSKESVESRHDKYYKSPIERLMKMYQ